MFYYFLIMIKNIQTVDLSKEKILKNKQIELVLFYHRIERVNTLSTNFCLSLVVKNQNQIFGLCPNIIWGNLNEKEQKNFLLYYREHLNVGFIDKETNKTHFYNINEISCVNLYIKF
jgi:hypothetical protein